MLDRRELMKRAGVAALATGFGSSKLLALQSTTLPIGNGERPLVKYPQKRPLTGLPSRPPQLESNWLRSINARATAAAFSIPAWPAANWATAQWETRAG